MTRYNIYTRYIFVTLVESWSKFLGTNFTLPRHLMQHIPQNSFLSVWHCPPFPLRGSSIYDVHKKIQFLTPPSVHMRLHKTYHSPCGRPYVVDMKYTSLS